MATEIERKFLVKSELLPKDLPAPDELEQGYLSIDPTVRVRLVSRPDGTRHAELTIKGEGLLSRAEFNYPIPLEDAEALLRLCKEPAQAQAQARPLGAGPLPRARSVAGGDRTEIRGREVRTSSLAGRRGDARPGLFQRAACQPAGAGIGTAAPRRPP